MTKRDEHCAFAQLNQNGRCIAYCHYNRGPVTEDCTGKEGKTMEYTDTDEQHREVKI
jgi:hypothetical protein